jgi:hypothetical protein
MKRYNINTRRTYEKDGKERTQWLRVGSLADFEKTEEREESFIMELSMFPHTRFFIFPEKKKEEKAADEKPEVETEEVSEDEVSF